MSEEKKVDEELKEELEKGKEEVVLTSRQKIDKIYEINTEVKAMLDVEGELYKKATSHGAKQMPINRKGKNVIVTEAELWEDARVCQYKGEATDILKKKYPEVFEQAEKRELKNVELHNFILEQFGFNFKAMGVTEFFQLCEITIEAKTDEIVAKVLKKVEETK